MDVYTLTYKQSAAGMGMWVGDLQRQYSAFEPREAGRQVEGLFESLLSQSFSS
jgi:hypothetical protein